MPTVTIIQPTITEEKSAVIRCAAYCRMSSDSADQLNSFMAQLKYYENFLADSETEKLINVYADEGVTGTREDKREDFQRMMSDCRKGKIDVFTPYRIQSNERGLQRVAPSNESYGQ